MSFFKSIFNREPEIITEYVDDLPQAVDPMDVLEEDKVVLAVTIAALASEGRLNADYKIKSIRRVK